MYAGSGPAALPGGPVATGGPPPPPQQEVEAAKRISKRTVIDVVLDVGGEVLKEVLGINDIKDCFTKGDAMACVNTAMNIIPWGKVTQIPKIAKAIGRAWDAVQVFLKEMTWAKAVLRRADEAAEAAKRTADNAASAVGKGGDDVAKAADNGAEAVAKHTDEAPARAGRGDGSGGKNNGDTGGSPGDNRPSADVVPFYPKNDGFQGTPQAAWLMSGERLDRFGSEYGRFASPVGVPMPMRALPPGAADRSYNVYEVVKPFQVQAGTIAPAFGHVGGGTQYVLPLSVKALLARGVIKRVG
jgi:hypothetical protein